MSLNSNNAFVPSNPTLGLESPQIPTQFIANLTPKQSTSFTQIGNPTQLKPHRIVYGSSGFVQINKPLKQDNFKHEFYSPHYRIDMTTMGANFI